jgi:hypothetical protein
MNQTKGESEGSETSSDRMTRHPILVLPKVSAESGGTDSFSPATGGGPALTAEPVEAAGRPDGIFPRTSFLPDPAHLNSQPTHNDAGTWPERRPMKTPRGDGRANPSGDHFGPLDSPAPSTQWEQPPRVGEPLSPTTRHDARADAGYPGPR